MPASSGEVASRNPLSLIWPSCENNQMENETDFNPIEKQFLRIHAGNVSSAAEYMGMGLPPQSFQVQERRKKEARERFRLALRLEALGLCTSAPFHAPNQRK